MKSRPKAREIPRAESPEEAIDQLGDPTATFKPGMENLLAGLILGTLFLLGGVGLLGFLGFKAMANGDNFLPWLKQHGFDGTDLIWMVVVGIAVVGSGIGILLWVNRSFSLRIHVCPGGLFWSSRKGVEVFPWAQVESVEETPAQRGGWARGSTNHAVPMGKNRAYVIHRKDGVEFGFDCNTVKKLNTLVKMLQQATRQHGIPWEVG